MPGAKVIKPKTKKDKDKLKAEVKKKSVMTRIKDKFFGGSKAKASTIKPKKKPKKPTTSDRQPSIKKANERKESSRDYVTRQAGVSNTKMPRAKDSQVMKAEAARRAAGKKRAAKKTANTKAADNRDAKRGGFISANAMKSSAKNANAKMAANKKRKSDELVSRGRK